MKITRIMTPSGQYRPKAIVNEHAYQSASYSEEGRWYKVRAIQPDGSVIEVRLDYENIQHIAKINNQIQERNA